MTTQWIDCTYFRLPRPEFLTEVISYPDHHADFSCFRCLRRTLIRPFGAPSPEGRRENFYSAIALAICNRWIDQHAHAHKIRLYRSISVTCGSTQRPLRHPERLLRGGESGILLNPACEVMLHFRHQRIAFA